MTWCFAFAVWRAWFPIGAFTPAVWRAWLSIGFSGLLTGGGLPGLMTGGLGRELGLRASCLEDLVVNCGLRACFLESLLAYWTFRIRSMAFLRAWGAHASDLKACPVNPDDIPSLWAPWPQFRDGAACLERKCNFSIA